jgi:hypothetical protein
MVEDTNLQVVDYDTEWPKFDPKKLESLKQTIEK